MRSNLRLLTDRRFALLFSARTVSVLGTAISPVALAFAVLDLPGASATTLGLVLAAQAVPEVLFLLLGGVIADRFPRYRVMVGAELVAGCSLGVLATAFIVGTPAVPLVMGLAAVNGIATAMFFPALIGIVPQVVPADQLQGANGLLRLSTNGSRILGLAIAGALVVFIGPGWALAVDAATFLVSAVLLAGVRVPNTRVDAGSGLLGDLKHGWREFSSRQWIWVIVLQFSVLNAATTAGVGVLGPVIAKRDLGGAAAWSTILAGEAIGMLLGVRFDIFGVLWETALQQHIPADALSRVSSYDAVGSFMMHPVGLLVAGPAAGLFGLETALYGCAALIIVSTALALLSPEVRQLRAVEPVMTGRGLPG